MEKSGLKITFEIIELAGHKALNIIFSFILGFFTSKAEISNELSPFSLSYLSIMPCTELSVIATYIGSFLGFITKSFSVFNFKYICANTIIFLIILIFGKKQYNEKVYSPILTGVICFTSGLLFLFVDSFEVINLLLLICESILCSCAAYFGKYFFNSVNKKSKLETKDIISFNITVMILICVADSYYISGFSISLILTTLIIYLSSYYLERKIAAVFVLPVCLIMTILHSTIEYYFLILYLPSLTSILISKFDKKHVIISYLLPYSSLLALNGITAFNLNLLLSPIVSAIIYYLIPKNVISKYLKNYIDVFEPISVLETKTNYNEVCSEFCISANKLITKINETENRPIINKELEIKLKKYLFSKKCRNITINNYYNNSNKQIIAISCKTDGNLTVPMIKNELSKLSGMCFSTADENIENGVIRCSFEQTEKYKVECYALYKAKSGEKICGDNVGAFKSIDSEYTLILADGMGSGKDAYTKSRETINLLKKLLKSGVSIDKSLETANSSISILKDGIGFTTVDICSISLDTAVAEFVKCGAFTSFVMREKQLMTIVSGGFPIGLNENISYTSQTVQLLDGDYIIMMSDGVSNAVEHLQTVLLLNEYDTLEALTKELMDSAFNNTPYEFDDDMTVMTAKIVKRVIE